MRRRTRIAAATTVAFVLANAAIAGLFACDPAGFNAAPLAGVVYGWTTFWILFAAGWAWPIGIVMIMAIVEVVLEWIDRAPEGEK